MIEESSSAEPRLSSMQMAWLQEMGIDRQLLARFRRSAEITAAAWSTAGERVSHDVSPMAAPPLVDPPTLVPTRTLLKVPGHPGREASSVSAVEAGAGAGPRAVAHDWAALQIQVANCEACSLCTNRRQAVFGAGVADSPAWMVIGEAPGEQDDRDGRPFQGRAGILLGAMLAAAGVDAEAQVFYANLVKCRPLGNRTPRLDEVNACLPYLQRQIALLKPQRILVLGKLAAQALVGKDDDFESLRGTVHVFRSETGVDIPLVATYHPAFLLSRPQHKAHAWRDLSLARSCLVSQ
jgi:DNA polymerase